MSLFNELKRRNVIRVAIAYLAGAWLLSEVAATLFPLFGFGETPARIVVILLAIGFPLFLVFSWVFEITPEGLKLEKDIDRTAPDVRKAGKQLDRIIIVLLALALGYFAFDKFVIEPVRVAEIVEETAQQARSEALVESYGDKSIAVLPFENISADPEQVYFSHGISEELLNLLAQIPGLRVPARTSSFNFEGKGSSISEIADFLDVAHVLEGSVRKAGNRVRVTAQLIEARSDTHLWSQTYDRDLDDIFAIQDDICGAIVEALKAKLGLAEGDVKPPTMIRAASMSAYDAYLQGRELVHKRDAMDEAVRLLELAVELDEGFAPAHAQLAIAISMMSGVTMAEKKRRALPHLDRAQAIEPDLAEAHGGRALLAYMAGNHDSAISHARKALSINPNYIDAMHWLRSALMDSGHDEEAEALQQAMLAIDPLSVPALTRQALQLSARGKIREAHEVADRIMTVSVARGSVIHGQISQLDEGKLADSLAWGLKGQAAGFVATWAFLWVGEYDEARRSGTELVWDSILSGRWEHGIEAATALARENPDIQAYQEQAGEAFFYARRMDEALAYYERMLDSAPEGQPIGTWWNLTVTMNFARARRVTGDEEGAQYVAGIVRQSLSDARAAGVQSIEMDLSAAMLAAFERDPDRAIEALRSAVRRGFVFLVYVDGPVFDELRDDPRFLELRRSMEARLEEEHEKVLQLICFDNPVPDEWQPMPQTCEGVVDRSEL
jgi:TolB-like protein